MTGRVQRYGQQLFALVAGVGLVVGIPALLLFLVGWPLPTSVPDVAAIGVALQQGNISGEFVIKLLAVVIWGLWVQLAWALLWETVVNGRRLARGVRTVSAPWVLPPLNLLAARLVSAIAAIGLVTTTAAATTVLPATPSLAVVAPDKVERPIHPPAVAKEPTNLSGRHILVLEGESLWSIAELMLGDGARSAEVLELNPHLEAPRAIRPGMQLTLPVGASVPEDRLVPTTALDAVEIGVERGDTLWGLASERLAEVGVDGTPALVANYVEEVVDVNGAEIDNRDLIFPGQVLTMPQIDRSLDRVEVQPDGDAPEGGESETVDGDQAGGEGQDADPRPLIGTSPTSRPVTSAPVMAPPGNPAERPNGTTPEPTTAKGAASLEVASGSNRSTTTRLLGAASALLAAGALRHLKRRRRFRMAHRRPGTVPSIPEPSLGPLEEALSREADSAAADWLRCAVGSLASRPIWDGELVAHPVLVLLDDERVEVEFSAPDYMAGPVPWSTNDEGRTWRLPRSFESEELPIGGVESPVPLLVTVGEGTLLNLESVGALQICGSGDRPRGLVRSIVHELANSPAAALIDIRLCVQVEGVDDYRLVQSQAPAAVAEELHPWLDELEALYADCSSSNAYGHRISKGSEALGPVLVVVDEEGRRELSSLVERAATGTFPLSIITVGPNDVGDRFSVAVSERGVVLEPWGLRLEPQSLSADVAQRLGALLQGARSSSDEPLVPAVQLSATISAPMAEDEIDEPTKQGLADADPHIAVPDPVVSEDAVLEDAVLEDAVLEDVVPEHAGPDARVPSASTTGMRLGVLGPIELSGGPDALTSQQLSLICHIACSSSPNKASIIDALWDGQSISESRLPNLLAETRAKIGRQHLPEVKDGIYRLQGVETDLECFERLVAATHRSSESEVGAALRDALELVRGVPFTPPSSRFWTWVGDQTHYCMRAEAVVADTAVRLARLELSGGSPERARWACEQGLLASPADETLVATLVDVYMELGKPALARRLVDGWEEQISRLDCGEPSDEPRKRLARSG